MRIVSIRLTNWLCYAGDMTIQLADSAYAVVAELSTDAGRSNGLGKSSLIEAIAFALFGVHRKRLEDDWITKDMLGGGVSVVFDDGTEVTRERTRGKATSLTVKIGTLDVGGVEPPDEELVLKKDAAQDWLEKWLGVDLETFRATSYFAQRKMAQLILADPQERMRLVSSWLRLEKLQTAEALARKGVSDWETKLTSAQTALAMAEDEAKRCRMVIDEFDAAGGTTGLVEEEESLRVLGEELEAQEREEARAVDHWAQVMGDFARLGEEYRKVEAEIAQLPKPPDESMLKLHDDNVERQAGKMETLRQRLTVVKSVAAGSFLGACPVSQGFTCPSTDEINARAAYAADEAVQLNNELRDLDRGYREIRSIQSENRRLASERTAKLARREVLAERGRLLKPEVTRLKALGEPVQTPGLRERRMEVQAQWGKLQGEKRSIQDANVRYAEANNNIGRHLVTVAHAREQVALHRQAAAIFGRNGAQRRVAEGALECIETEANALLRDAGIDLSIGVQWSREGSGKATSCDQCGTAFPSSAKVKECPKCGAPRGALLVNKLEIVLSDRSGALEDLAGIALQLAAAAWLRRARGSRLELAILDEPFGALDRSYRRALSTALPKMLSAAGIKQAFVIAHSPDVLAALPGRIEIHSNDGRSTLEVKS